MGNVMPSWFNDDVRVFQLKGRESLERFLLEILTLTWGAEHDRKHGYALERKAEIIFVTSETNETYNVGVLFREWDKASMESRDMKRIMDGPSFKELGMFDFLPK